MSANTLATASQETTLYVVLFEEGCGGEPIIFSSESAAQKLANDISIRKESDRYVLPINVKGWTPEKVLFLVVNENWYGGHAEDVKAFLDEKDAVAYKTHIEEKTNAYTTIFDLMVTDGKEFTIWLPATQEYQTVTNYV